MESIVDVVNKFLGEEMLTLLENATKATDVLKADHRKVDMLLAEFKKAEGKDKQILLDTIVKELTVHSLVEEEFVYPIVAQKDSAKAAEANEEHHMVKLSLAELKSMPATSALAEPKVKVLGEMVKHHVKEEEHKIFPLLEKSNVDLDDLGIVIRNRKNELMSKMKSIGEQERTSKKASAKSTSKKNNRNSSQPTKASSRRSTNKKSGRRS